MPGFWDDWSSPKSEPVDPRSVVRIQWFYFIDSANDNPLVYWKVYLKEASILGWTDPAVKIWTLPPEVSYFDVPPYTMELGKQYVWRVEAYAIDRRYDPSLPDPQYWDDPATTEEEATLISGTPFTQGDVNHAMDATGYTMYSEDDGSFPGATVGFWPGIPPGVYEMRVKVRNGLVWSDWSATMDIKAYDTKKFVRKAGLWVAIPSWTKQGGTMKQSVVK